VALHGELFVEGTAWFYVANSTINQCNGRSKRIRK
jgi:hypothetical protein